MTALSGAEPDARPTADEPEVARLRRIEEIARGVATYHVLGYGHIDEDVPWDANVMLRLLDQLAAALNE